MPEWTRYILWGSTGHAKVLADVIKLNEGQVIAVCDNDPNAQPSLPGIPLLYGYEGLTAWMSEQRSLRSVGAALAIGGRRGADREELGRDLEALGFSLPCLIHPSAVVSGSAVLGEGSQVLAAAVLAPEASLGRVCIVNNGANVDHECTLGDGVHVAPGAVLCGSVSVGDNAMIGAGAVVLPRLKIGKDAIVGAGSVVTDHVGEGCIIAGNPAKPIQRA
jgi:sugar O-acyltransferase (sialic acid O-acetyltransferase NeuD family)